MAAPTSARLDLTIGLRSLVGRLVTARRHRPAWKSSPPAATDAAPRWADCAHAVQPSLRGTGVDSGQTRRPGDGFLVCCAADDGSRTKRSARQTACHRTRAAPPHGELRRTETTGQAADGPPPDLIDTEEVAGSNPVSPTILLAIMARFFISRDRASWSSRGVDCQTDCHCSRTADP
jgi:hypothetical protein